MVGIDLDYCKGCGICAAACPPRTAAIKWLTRVLRRRFRQLAVKQRLLRSHAITINEAVAYAMAN